MIRADQEDTRQHHRDQALEDIEGETEVAPFTADRAGQVRRPKIARADSTQVLAVRRASEGEWHGTEQISGHDKGRQTA
jgi:hypothetical protein